MLRLDHEVILSKINNTGLLEKVGKVSINKSQDLKFDENDFPNILNDVIYLFIYQ